VVGLVFWLIGERNRIDGQSRSPNCAENSVKLSHILGSASDHLLGYFVSENNVKKFRADLIIFPHYSLRHKKNKIKKIIKRSIFCNKKKSTTNFWPTMYEK